MANNLSAAAAKTLRTIAATTAGHVDCYAGTKGIDCRTLKALVRKGYLVVLGTLFDQVTGKALAYNRHAITAAGRGAVAPVIDPSGIIYPTTGKVDYIDDEGYSIDLDNMGLRTGSHSNWVR